MKSLGAVWIYGSIVAFLGVSVDCGAIGYPGRMALLSYSPARGEFPVASLFGRGFFSYIDENGNSRVVRLEPSPLLGVRIDAEGRPLFEFGRQLNLETAAAKEPCGKAHQKDRLKPIKEFDERPFEDTLHDIDIRLPALDVSKLELVTVSAINEIPGQTKQFFVFPSELPAKAPNAKECQSLDPSAEGTQSSTASPVPPTPPSPTRGAYVQANPELNLSYLPPKPVPGPVFLNPENPFLPQGSNSVQSTTPTLISATPPTTSKPATPTQPPASTASPMIPMPSTPSKTPSPTAPPSTSTFPSFAPGNPFLPTPASVSVSPNPTPTPTAAAPRPPAPPKNPFLSPDRPKEPRPTFAKPTPQFNADKMNPFLPSSGSNPSSNPSTPHFESNSVALPEQVKDTPEVEQAKREHFLAHQMALAQLQLAQHQDGVKRDETPSISSTPSTPLKLPRDVDTSEDVTSRTVIPEPTEDSPPTTDAAPLLV